MTQMYITAILNVPPSDVAEFFTDVLVNLMASFKNEGCSYQWLQAALTMVPLNVYTDENKKMMLENLSDQKEFRRGTLMEDFDILAKRAKGSATRQK